MSDRPRLAYKVLTEAELAELRQGGFAGSSADRADGFIHLSTAEQLAGTVDRHFAGRDGLWIAAVDLAALGDAVRWEESRGGALFPTSTPPFPLAAVMACAPLERAVDGTVKAPIAGQDFPEPILGAAPEA